MLMLIFKIAWRNIWRHKGKSLVIGTIIFIGVLLMTVGNGMISGMERGLGQNIVNLFTGDIVIIPNDQEKDDVLFDFMNGKPLKVINNYKAIKQVLHKEACIKGFIPVTAGMVFVLNSGSGMGIIRLLGVDINQYQKIFPKNLKITQGRTLRNGERGVLISEETRDQCYNLMNFWLLPRGQSLDQSKLSSEALKNVRRLNLQRHLVFMGASDTNTFVDVKIPVIGIMKYKALNKIWGTYSIVDIESFREGHNYFTAYDTAVKIPPAEQGLLNNDQFDELFNSDNLIETETRSNQEFTVDSIQTLTRKRNNPAKVDDESYNMVFLKLKPGVSSQTALHDINTLFKQNKLKVHAINWRSAVGMFGSIAALIKGALNLFIMFVFFIAIIVIMNTLSMAALERVTETAMMRAIGAGKGFLTNMYICETGILAFFFGAIGIIVGIIVIFLLNAANITTTNEFLQLVYGGDKLSPIFILPDLIIGIMELGMVTILSVLYPLRLVGKIVPLDAMARD
jgi:putative ABC transport system permease protein